MGWVTLGFELVKGTIDIIAETVKASKERQAELAARLEELWRAGADAIFQLSTGHESEHQQTMEAFAEARRRIMQP